MIGNSAGIRIEQSQKVKLTPAQLRTVEILQMSNAELQQKISDELLENPVLEPEPYRPDEPEGAARQTEEPEEMIGAAETAESDRFDRYDQCDPAVRKTDSWSSSYGITRGASRAAEFEAFYKSSETLREHLLTQLMGSKCTDAVRTASEFIIYSLDSNGYLDISMEDIVRESGCAADDVRAALSIVRSMDPAGLAAWTLEECLRLQLDKNCPHYADTCKVIETMLHEVATGDIRSISRTLGIDPEDVLRIISIIKGLDPKPGARFSDGDAVQYVMPDIEIEVINGQAIVHMTDVQPPLGLNRYYCDLLENTDDKEVIRYLKDKIESANQLIDNIEQRKRTVESVTLAILARQRNFLEPGNKILEPLTMQQIADDLGIHVSTVSRAVREKYIRFPNSTYPLKYFFTNEVGGVSRDNIYSRIREIIAEEDRSKPLSDNEIVDILRTKGIKTSRRTVAKYRDSMGILPKSLRREIGHP